MTMLQSEQSTSSRIPGIGQVIFAVTMIALAIMSFRSGDFAPIWQPAPKAVPARDFVVYLCAIISLLSGCGLLWRRTAGWASRLLLVYLLLWLLLFRLPPFLHAPTAQDSWSGWGETGAIVAGAWVLYAWFAPAWDRRNLAFASGEKGLRIARILFAVSLIIFGLAHFRYPDETATLVPAWLPWHIGWAWFTGGAFVATGLAVLTGFGARLAAALAALEIGLFTLLIWVPFVVAGAKPFQRSEFVISWVITAAAWVVADSYRDRPWIGRSERVLSADSTD